MSGTAMQSGEPANTARTIAYLVVFDIGLKCPNLVTAAAPATLFQGFVI